MPEHRQVSRSPPIGVRYHRWRMKIVAHPDIIAAIQPAPGRMQEWHA